MSLESFHLAVPEDQLDRVRKQCNEALEQLAAFDANTLEANGTLNADDLTYGLPPSALRRLLARLGSSYDWRNQERAINGMGEHYTLAFDDASESDLKVHFVHARSSRPNAKPLLLAHGWPGSFLEFKDAVPLLTNPPDGQQAFHVVVPSLLGFAFSSAPKKGYTRLASISASCKAVMDTLGYNKWYAQGGDWGSAVVRRLSVDWPEHCQAIHVNFAFAANADFQGDEAGQVGTKRMQEFLTFGRAYSEMQGTVPYTIGAVLGFNIASLVAYIAEKMMRWTDPDSRLSDDFILTNILLYWFSGSITSSFWLYFNRKMGGDVADMVGRVVKAPCAFSPGRSEIQWPPERLLRQTHPNLVSYELLEKGGHFLAAEVPAVFAATVRSFFSREEVASLI